MATRTTTDRDREERFGEIVFGYLQAAERGESTDRHRLLADHPEFAVELEQFLGNLEGVGRLARPIRALIDPAHAATSALSDGGTLGDFRLIREVGRGGMGVVYEAEQISLSRRVALKVLPFAATMDPRQLQRFRNEAQAAACLHHPNIVPVHGVGIERGVHYYAMQLIEGQTLAEIIASSREREQPESGRASQRERDVEDSQLALTPRRDVEDSHVALTPRRSPSTAPIAALSTKRDRTHFRSIAELIATAADALEYAHSMGVVHRDIKPGNLMLDNGGGLWITDFGLAKTLSPGVHAGELTLTGDMIGTLRYMSPEAALAKHGLVDHRTDVYSLGATLYELLTLKPAVDGADKAEMLKRIAWDEPTPLRKHDKSIPAELETITLKCLAKEPGERYASAGEMADDLRRWLGDKPIAARPLTLVQRIAKWIRRHPGVSTTAFVSFVALGLLVIAGMMWSNRLMRLQQAETQKAWSRTRETLDRMSSEIVDEWLSRQSKINRQQRQFLEFTLARYEELSEESGNSPEQRCALARAYARVGTIRCALGMYDESEVAYRRSIEILNALVRAKPGVPDYEAGMAAAHLDHARLQMRRGQRDEAIASCNSARVFLEPLVYNYSAEPKYARDLAATYNNSAVVQLGRGQHAEALTSFVAARRLLEAVVHAYPGLPKYTQSLAAAHNNIAMLQAEHGELKEALKSYESARSLREQLLNDNPDTPEYTQDLARTHSNIGVAQADLQHFDDALRSYEAARALLGSLVQRFPSVPDYTQDLVRAFSNIALSQIQMNRPQDALVSIESARTLLEPVQRSHPDAPDYAADLGRLHHAAGLAHIRLRQPEKALEAYQAALVLRQRLFDGHGDVARFAVDLGWTSCNIGNIQLDAGNAASALSAYSRAIEVVQRVADRKEALIESRECWQASQLGRIDALNKLGRHDEALSDCDRAIAVDNGRDPSFRVKRAETLMQRGAHGRAADAAEEVAELPGVTAQTIYDSACVCSRCVAVARKDVALPPPERDKLAERYADRAVALLRQAIRAGYRDAAHMHKDTDLDPLREREEFKNLIADLERMPK